VRWTPKSQGKLKSKVRQITKRTRGHSPTTVIAELATYLRGAFNDYQLGIAFGEARELDHWLRSRVRLYFWTARRGALPDGEALTAEPDEGGINSGAGREPVDAT